MCVCGVCVVCARVQCCIVGVGCGYSMASVEQVCMRLHVTIVSNLPTLHTSVPVLCGHGLPRYPVHGATAGSNLMYVWDQMYGTPMPGTPGLWLAHNQSLCPLPRVLAVASLH